MHSSCYRFIAAFKMYGFPNFSSCFGFRSGTDGSCT